MSIIKRALQSISKGTFFADLNKTVVNEYKRMEKHLAHHNMFIPFDKHRIRTGEYLKAMPGLTADHYPAGNYYLDKRWKLNEESIVYSLGILNYIVFDQYLIENVGCVVHMFDPAPVSADYMEQYKDEPKYAFRPIGVWTEPTTLKFYINKYGGSPSAMEKSTDDYFESECRTVKQIMKDNGHTTIDVFKADIEGAALPIVEKMLQDGILATQFLVEFERPRKGQVVIDDFFERLDKLRAKFKRLGYEEYAMPREEYKYFSLELLFVKTPE